MNFLAKNRDKAFFTTVLIQSTHHFVSDMNGDDSNLKPLNILILFPYLRGKSEKKNSLSRSVEMCIMKTAKDGNPRVTTYVLFVHRMLSSTQAPPCVNASAGALGWVYFNSTKNDLDLHLYLYSNVCWSVSWERILNWAFFF